jgi:hypothetical protein
MCLMDGGGCIGRELDPGRCEVLLSLWSTQLYQNG